MKSILKIYPAACAALVFDSVLTIRSEIRLCFLTSNNSSPTIEVEQIGKWQ